MGFLFGKPLLETFRGTHNYEMDEITIMDLNKTMTLRNQAHLVKQVQSQSTTPHATFIVTDDETMDKDELLSKLMTMPYRIPKAYLNGWQSHSSQKGYKRSYNLSQLGMTLAQMNDVHRVCQLIMSFVDVFALSVAEVKVVQDANWLDIHLRQCSQKKSTRSYNSTTKALSIYKHWCLRLEWLKPVNQKMLYTVAQKTVPMFGHFV